MIIEFFGFPGSGKTTIYKALKKDLQSRGFETVNGTFDHLKGIQRYLLKGFYSTLCLFISPRFYFYNIKFFVTYKGAFNYFLNITYIYCRYKIYENSNKIVVFDQGLIQGCWSIFSFVDQGDKYNIPFLLSKPQHIIFVELDIEENKRRLIKRGKKNQGFYYSSKNFTQQFQSFVSFKAFITQNSGLSLHVVHSQNDVKSIVNTINKKLPLS